MTFFYYLIICIFPCIILCSSTPSFTIDYENDIFLKDGKPFRYISGTLHYFQIPHALWRDRMERSRAVGINTIQTYVSWNIHEPMQNKYNFDNDANLTEYLQIAKNLSLLVILRIGPYIDAEQDFGGLPYWLLKYPDIRLRSSADNRYKDAVSKWFSVLLPKISPLLYANGGPVIMVQIENEYGSYGCDKKYTMWLQALTMHYLQDKVVYFTTDGNGGDYLNCGKLPDTLTTIDFGAINESAVQLALDLLRTVMPSGPLVNSEFYPGWYDIWGRPSRRTQSSAIVTDTMRFMWRRNASFNIYPIHGGSNWGYQGGGECCPFGSVTTGYDFDAPISESGDVTTKFLDVKSTIEEITGVKVKFPLPVNSTKTAYGRVPVQYLGNIFDMMFTLTSLISVKRSDYPLTMEQLDHPFGFVLYESTLVHGARPGGYISVKGVHDRAYVIIGQRLVDVIQRSNKLSGNRKVLLPRGVEAGSKIHILVENQGRVAYGQNLNDSKGLLANVTLGEENLMITNWTMYPLRLENIFGNYGNLPDVSLKKFTFANKKKFLKEPKDKTLFGSFLPSFYLGYLMPDNANITDTFFDPTGWGKGQLVLNGVNVGRYWPDAGPQITLYVPVCYLSGFNQIVIFELDKPGNCKNDKFSCSVSFTDRALYKTR